jgi:DNA-binding PadR family transcriptional regulator
MRGCFHDHDDDERHGWRERHFGGRHGGRHGERGWGARGWGGREGRGGFGGRMFGPGDLRLVLMALIEQQPRHGYELIKAVEDLFGGAYAPSPGAVYPTLSLLEDQGHLASATDEGGKRVFSLTEQGQAWLAENRAAVEGVMMRLRLVARRMSGEAAPETVREAIQTLKLAVMAKPGDWSEAETGRVVEILMNAVRDIGGK